MSTTRSFQNMLNEFLTNDLLKEEFVKRDYILSNVENVGDWYGGKVPVPFRAQQASSIKMGGLTASTDIAQDKYVRGSIDDYIEAWGSMIFNARDLTDQSGKVKEDSFLKILPDMVDDFMEYMKMIVSVQLGTGPVLATVTDSTNAASGIQVVSRIDRFQLDQKVTLVDGNTAAASFYVIAIVVDTSSITLSATRGGSAADVSAYTTSQLAKVYTDGADTTSFQSIKSALLSAANGGGSTLHGQSKIAYPYLQAVNVSGSAITATNILSQLFDAFTTIRQKAKGGKADTFLMSYKNGGSVLKAVENNATGATGGYRGNYDVSIADKTASLYGWDEVTIRSVKGTLKVVMVQEWDDDVIAIMDMTALKFLSNGMFRKQKSPDGNEYYVVRNTTGYQYIIDICLFGELMVHAPGKCGIIYGISY